MSGWPLPVDDYEYKLHTVRRNPRILSQYGRIIPIYLKLLECNVFCLKDYDYLVLGMTKLPYTETACLSSVEKYKLAQYEC